MKHTLPTSRVAKAATLSFLVFVASAAVLIAQVSPPEGPPQQPDYDEELRHPERFLAGRVLFGEDEPLPSASVDVSCGVQPLFQLSTDTSGWFEAPREVTPQVCNREELILTVLRIGFKPTQVTIPLSSPVVFTTVVLEPIDSVAGRFAPVRSDGAAFPFYGLIREAGTGRPIPGARITLRLRDEAGLRDAFGGTSAYSRASGFFSVFLPTQADGARAELSVTKEGFKSKQAAFAIGTRRRPQDSGARFLDEQQLVPVIELSSAGRSRWRASYDFAVIQTEAIPELKETGGRLGLSGKFFPFGTPHGFNGPEKLLDRVYIGLGAGFGLLEEKGRGGESRSIALAEVYADVGLRFGSIAGVSVGVGFVRDRGERFDSLSLNLSLLVPLSR